MSPLSSAGNSGSDESIEEKASLSEGEELVGGNNVLSSSDKVVKCSAEEDNANRDERQGETTSKPRNSSMAGNSSGHSIRDTGMGKSRDSKQMKVP